MSVVRTERFSIVSVTSPNIKHARKLSRKLLAEGLCACVHLIPKVESHYWWKEKLTTSTEAWLVIKTQASKVKKLEQLIRKNHPYEVPEIVEIKITGGSKDYLQWIQESLSM